MTRLAAALLALAVLAPAPGLAQAPSPPTGVSAPAVPESDGSLSLTVSPVHLLFPVLEVTAEVRLESRFSLALIGGYGHFLGVRLQEFGGQARYYPGGRFAGFHVGAEALYVRADLSDWGTSAYGDGLSIGPFVGYKARFATGFTLEGQVGAAVLAVRAHSGSSSSSSSAGGRVVLPLLNFNLGWTF